MNLFWYILIGFAVFIALLLISTVGADIRYSDTESIVRVKFNGITVFKLPFIPERIPPALVKKKSQKALEKLKTEDELAGLFTGVREILSYAKRTLSIFYQKLFKKIIVNELKIHLSVGTEDPVRTTVLFGNLSALVNAVCATLSYMVTLKRCDINIVPDYASNETRANLRAVFKLRILWLLFVAAALYPMYKELKERKKKNEQPSDQRSDLKHHGEAD